MGGVLIGAVFGAPFVVIGIFMAFGGVGGFITPLFLFVVPPILMFIFAYKRYQYASLSYSIEKIQEFNALRKIFIRLSLLLIVTALIGIYYEYTQTGQLLGL